MLNSAVAQIDLEQLVQGLSYRNIGPANSGGRVVDIESNEKDFTKVYVAAASGGVWKSENAGTSWTPIFDDYETASIGDIALDPNDENTIWVGTGEANNRNSVSWGNGVYKSVDGGKAFEYMGLASTHQIARVLVNPMNGDDVCVCAIGHLWGYSGERGLFQTKDGGKNWTKLKGGLPNDGKTGCTDIVRDPKNPNIIYAAFYHRLRQAWHFHSGGQAGGIFKSTDNGKTWKALQNGLPQGPTGRIGLALAEQNPNVLMAIVEAEQSDDLNTAGSGIYRSEDGGEHWTYVNTYNNRPFYYSQIRIDPFDDQKIYVLTTSLMVSADGGKTLENGSKDQEVHGDFHALEFDPNQEGRFYLGADKGFSITHDHGAHYRLIDNLPITQFYRIAFDYRQPYYVYGGLQDNGSYATASFARDARGILNDYNWKMHWGDGQDPLVNPYDWTDMYSNTENGGFIKYNPLTRQIHTIKPTVFNTINYSEYYKKDQAFLDHIRWNWSAPMVMSAHNPKHIFVGGNHVFKSIDQGQSWQMISPDLSTQATEKIQKNQSGGITPDNTGAETHASIHSLAVSTLSEDVIWTGTDDGNVHVSYDGGENWFDCTPHIPDLPKNSWVSRIIASHFEAGRAYVSFDGHRSDEFQAWVYTTEDYGRNWYRINKGLEGQNVRVIREDIANANLLFAGTETAVYYSINAGMQWQKLKLNMPTVSIYDMKIHPRENDLIIGTHGRGIWIMDDISPLQQLAADVLEKELHLFKQKEAVIWQNISRGGQRGHAVFAGENPKVIKNTSSVPRARFESLAAISFYVGDASIDSLQLEIKDLKSGQLQELNIPVHYGINRYYWDRLFEAIAYSDAEYEQVMTHLEEVQKVSQSKYVKRTYKKFVETTDPLEQRQLFTALAVRYLNAEVNPDLLVLKANEGTYMLRLTNPKTSVSSSTLLTIRKDKLED